MKKNYFRSSFLFLGAKRSSHDLNERHSCCYTSEISQTSAKIWKAIFGLLVLFLSVKRNSHDLFARHSNSNPSAIRQPLMKIREQFSQCLSYSSGLTAVVMTFLHGIPAAAPRK